VTRVVGALLRRRALVRCSPARPCCSAFAAFAVGSCSPRRARRAGPDPARRAGWITLRARDRRGGARSCTGRTAAGLGLADAFKSFVDRRDARLTRYQVSWWAYSASACCSSPFFPPPAPRALAGARPSEAPRAAPAVVSRPGGRAARRPSSRPRRDSPATPVHGNLADRGDHHRRCSHILGDGSGGSGGWSRVAAVPRSRPHRGRSCTRRSRVVAPRVRMHRHARRHRRVPDLAPGGEPRTRTADHRLRAHPDREAWCCSRSSSCSPR
jgi:hypothetical protein